MARRFLQVQQPAGGLDRNYGYQSQPPYTICDGNNVRCRDVFEMRERLGSRPGLTKAFPQQLGNEVPSESFSMTFTPTKDTFVESHSTRKTAVNGSVTSMSFGNNSGAHNECRPIMHFDMSALPAGATIISAPFVGYIPAAILGGTWVERVSRLTQEGWVETQTNYNNYQTLATWAVNGGDFTDTTPTYIDFVTPNTTGWNTFVDLASLVQYAYTNQSKQFHTLWRRADESGTATQVFSIRSKEFDDGIHGAGYYAPYITVTYSVPG